MSEQGPALLQADVEAALATLGVGFTAVGTVEGPLRFASLRAPREAGIYFIEGGRALPGEVVSSLILVSTSADHRAGGNAFVRVDDPQRTFYRLMDWACPRPVESGVHPTAIVSAGSSIPDDCWIGPYCVIESGVAIGAGCHLSSHVVLKSGTELGDRVRIECHSTIGATGVAWVWDERQDRRFVQPQLGGVRIGSDVFIGSDVSVVRGSINEDTEIGDGTLVAHGTKIGHGCRIGKFVHFANNVSVAGNVDIGDRAFLGSGAVVRPQVRLGEAVVVGAGAVVVSDVPNAGSVVYGNPARPADVLKDRLVGVPTRTGVNNDD